VPYFPPRNSSRRRRPRVACDGCPFLNRYRERINSSGAHWQEKSLVHAVARWLADRASLPSAVAAPSNQSDAAK
jgi:hypothetical protein